MNARRGLQVGAGYPVRTPTLDIAEVGAGGGSIFWVDEGGAPRVGPRSAGAAPGPACYGAGGTEPTLSDAALVLGYLNPQRIGGGTQAIDPRLAEEALAKVAARLGIGLREAAHGAYVIAIANMTRLLKAVTTERGRDPRDSTLVAFGGAGPAYAAALAAELGIGEVIVPCGAGLFSAVGLLAADPSHDLVQPYLEHGIEASRVEAVLRELEGRLVEQLAADGYERSTIELSRSAEMRYQGQKGTLRIAIGSGTFGEREREDLLDRLEQEHFRTNRHRKARDAAAIASLRVRAVCRTRRPNPLAAFASALRSGGQETAGGRREVYFGPSSGALDTPVLGRHELEARPRPGPLLVEEMDTSIVVPPGASARLDELGDVVIRLGGR